MIVLVDATVIVADPFLGSTAWKMLAHASHRWDVRLCTTEVVLLEAVAGYKRRIDDANVAVERWRDKHARALGLDEIANEMRSRLDDQASSYGDKLKAALDALPVEVCAIPQVDHQILVERATHRVPPCNSKGDGYRDTLNWLTLIEVAKESSRDVLWVTADSGDYTDPQGTGLHSTLEQELNSLDLGGRVTLLNSLNEAALKIAAEFADDSEPDLRKVQERIKNEALISYVQSALFVDPTIITVDRASLALPVWSRAPFISTVGPVIHDAVKVKAPLDADAAAVEVVLTCDTTIVFETSSDSELGETFEVLEKTDEDMWAAIAKPLKFTALVTVDRYDRPTNCELTAVRAPSEDPGHRAWQAQRALRTMASDLDLLRNIQIPSIPTAAILEALNKNIQASLPTADILDTIRKNAQVSLPTADILASLRKNIQMPSVSTAAILEALKKNIQASLPTADILDTIRKNAQMSLPTFEALRDNEPPSPEARDATDDPQEPSPMDEDPSGEDGGNGEHPAEE